MRRTPCCSTWTPNSLIATKFNTNTDTTVLQLFLQQSPWVDQVIPWHKLALADAGGTGPRAVAYQLDRRVLEFEVPMELEFLDPQVENFTFKVPSRLKTAGVNIHYPLAVAYMDGI